MAYFSTHPDSEAMTQLREMDDNVGVAMVLTALALIYQEQAFKHESDAMGAIVSILNDATNKIHRVLKST